MIGATAPLIEKSREALVDDHKKCLDQLPKKIYFRHCRVLFDARLYGRSKVRQQGDKKDILQYPSLLGDGFP